LRLEITGLGTVDPFRLRVVEHVGDHFVETPGGPRTQVERAGICLVGASRALLNLSMGWLEAAGRTPEGPGPPPVGELHLIMKRRESRLLAALLRRHLGRLPQAPVWMGELLESLEEMEEFLRWDGP